MNEPGTVRTGDPGWFPRWMTRWCLLVFWSLVPSPEWEARAQQLVQTVTWTSPRTNEVLVLGRPYPSVAGVQSGLPVTFRIQSGPAFITNGSIVATNPGPITVVAEQAGNGSFAPTRMIRVLNQPSITVRRVSEWPGFARGIPSGLQLQGTRAFVWSWPGELAIWDVSDVDTPRYLGGVVTVGSSAAMQVSGNTAFLAEGGGLLAVDVSDPTEPVTLGRLEQTGSGNGLQLIGDRAYIARGTAGLEIVDISNPSMPRRLGGIGNFGDAKEVRVVGGMAYVAAGAAGFKVLDVSNPTNPVPLASFATRGLALDVAVEQGVAYVVDTESGIHALDVSNPAAPIPLSLFSSTWKAWSIEVNDGVAFVGDTSGYLELFDVRDPLRPAKHARINLGTNPSKKAIVGSRVWVIASGSLHSIDVRSPGTPVGMGSIPIQGYTADVQLVGSLAYTAGNGLEIVDVSDPMVPRRVGALGGRGNTVRVIGSLACLTADDSLEIVDVRNPSTPVLVGKSRLPGLGEALEVRGSLAFVAAGAAGLQVVDIARPTIPALVGSYDTAGTCLGVHLAGNLAYLADGRSGLLILDVTDPRSPRLLGALDTPGIASDVRIEGDIAYLADHFAGLQVIDVRDPAAPVLLGTFETRGRARRLHVHRGLVYVADELAGLIAVDATDPSKPTGFATVPLPGRVMAVQAAGDRAYVAAGAWGLQTLEVERLLSQRLRLDSPGTVTLDQSPVALSVTSSAGLPVTLRLLSGGGSLVGNRLTLTAPGSIVIRAEQPGADGVLPAATEYALSVLPGGLRPVLAYSTASRVEQLDLVATGGNGTPVVFESSIDLIRWTAFSTNTGHGSVSIDVGREGERRFFRARSIQQ
jgi:hypothetical protein